MTEAHPKLIKLLVDAGYVRETVVAAVEAKDFTRMKHSGLFSVQLQPRPHDE